MNAADLLDIAEKALRDVTSGCETEIFISRRTELTAKVSGGELKEFSAGDNAGAGVRVVHHGRLGFASTTDLSPDGLRRVHEEARGNAIAGSAAGVLPRPDGPVPHRLLPADRPAANPPEIIEAARSLENLTLASHAAVEQVPSAVVGQEVTRTAVASTLGVRAAHEHSDAYATASVLARRTADGQSGLGLSLGHSVCDLDLPAAAAEAAERATGLLGARKPATTEVPVVLDPLVTARLLVALAPAVNGEVHQHSSSLWAGRVGQSVASPVLSIIDDGTLADGPATAPVDDEGVPTQRTVLVGDGVLRGFLHSTESAARVTGERRHSTGNGRRTGFRIQPAVRPSNLLVAGTVTPARQIIADADGGLYVLDVLGAHSGINTVTGELSLGVAGRWIRGGELAGAVHEATIASTLDHLLGSVTAVGDDLRFFPLKHAVGGATLSCGTVTVSGS